MKTLNEIKAELEEVYIKLKKNINHCKDCGLILKEGKLTYGLYKVCNLHNNLVLKNNAKLEQVTQDIDKNKEWIKNLKIRINNFAFKTNSYENHLIRQQVTEIIDEELKSLLGEEKL